MFYFGLSRWSIFLTYKKRKIIKYDNSVKQCFKSNVFCSSGFLSFDVFLCLEMCLNRILFQMFPAEHWPIRDWSILELLLASIKTNHKKTLLMVDIWYIGVWQPVYKLNSNLFYILKKEYYSGQNVNVQLILAKYVFLCECVCAE